MDAKQLAEIKARAEKATPGPWEYTDNGFDGCISSKDGDFLIGGEPCEGRIEHDANTEFICHARTDIPALVAEIEQHERHEAAQYLQITRQKATILSKDQQIATLKKALELACEQFKDEGNCILEGCSGANCIQNCAKCMHDYFIRQAQEQEGLSNG